MQKQQNVENFVIMTNKIAPKKPSGKLKLVDQAGKHEGGRRFGAQNTFPKPHGDQPRSPCRLCLGF